MKRAKLLGAVLLALLIAGALAGSALAAEPPAQYKYGKIEGLVWEDTNGDGIYNEPLVLIDGVTLKLYMQLEDGAWSLIGTTVSGPGIWPNGWFAWYNLPTAISEINLFANYRIEMIPPAGYCATGGTERLCTLRPTCFWKYFYLDAALTEDRAFSLKKCEIPPPTPPEKPGSICGYKWKDSDRDGKHESGESGVKNVTIKLMVAGQTNAVATTVTGCDGSYCFKNVTPGSYTVTEVVPSGWEATSPASVNVTLASGQALTNIDFNNMEKKTSCGWWWCWSWFKWCW